MNQQHIKSVAVIGAGASGAAAAAALKAEDHFDHIKVFERRESAGGTWILDQDPGCIPLKPGALPPEIDPGDQSVLAELLATAKLFVSTRFLLIVPLIAQSVFAEAVFFTFQGLWFTVRTRALASFLSGIVAVIAGNVLGPFLDRQKWSESFRGRLSFIAITAMQGGWWIWGTVIVTQYRRTQPTFDWTSVGFGRGFAWFLFMVMSFQMNYLYLYFPIGHLARNEAEIIRFAGLLRGTESAAQAVSYGLSSVAVMGQVGCVYLNFGLWAISLVPAWFVVKQIGYTFSKTKREKENTVDGVKQ